MIRRTKSSIPFKETDGGRQDHNGRESNDCQIRALALATRIPYTEIHSLAGTLGRKPRKRFNTSDIIPSLLSHEFQHHTSDSTVDDFVRTHPEGEFIIRSHRHVCAVIDGMMHDIVQDMMYASWKLDSYWRVLPKSVL
jgi:hypothetical protein